MSLRVETVEPPRIERGSLRCERSILLLNYRPFKLVDRPGAEPGLAACKAAVLPLSPSAHFKFLTVETNHYASFPGLSMSFGPGWIQTNSNSQKTFHSQALSIALSEQTRQRYLCLLSSTNLPFGWWTLTDRRPTNSLMELLLPELLWSRSFLS